MTSVASSYTIHDFQQMLFEGTYTLDKDILDILQFVEKNIIIPPEAVNEASGPSIRRSADHPSFSGKMGDEGRSVRSRRPDHGGSAGSSRRGHGRREHREQAAMEWETLRSFKPTKMEAKEGIEKQMNEIRILLNKISSKNYETQKNLLLEQIATLFTDTDASEGGCENDEPAENRRRVSTMIFDIASTNKFLSELYADLYADIVAAWPTFGDILVGFVDRYRETLGQIHYVDPEKDYDGFCAYNKTNDLRKAMAAFIVNLMKRTLLDQESVLDLIAELQTLSRTYIDMENKTNEVDELTENIAVLVTMTKATLNQHERWTTIIGPAIQDMAKRKAKEHASLSSRVVFKYMDLAV